MNEFDAIGRGDERMMVGRKCRTRRRHRRGEENDTQKKWEKADPVESVDCLDFHLEPEGAEIKTKPGNSACLLLIVTCASVEKMARLRLPSLLMLFMDGMTVTEF